jgi:hypothetical protein
MRWFRANRRLGGRLALFALVVQLVLSFGHIHREDIFGPSFDRNTTVATQPAADQSRTAPADRGTNRTDDYCAICATASLLGNSFVAVAPQLAVPFVSGAIEHLDRVTAVVAAPRHTAFRSRAPPFA